MGNAKASLLFFFLGIHDTRGSKGFLVALFGTGVLLSCVAWDISTSGCFYTVQDLLGRPAQTPRVFGPFLVEEILHFVILRPASGRSWRTELEALSGIGRQRAEVPCSFGTL